MEIKVNDYVRTKDGLIFKIIGGNEDNWNLDIDYSILEYYEENWLELFKYNDNYSFFTNENIIKSSPNIGKLLKVGDFIDGMRIIKIEDTTIYTLGGWFIDIEDVEDLVKSVVTKEQFEQMEYKID